MKCAAAIVACLAGCSPSRQASSPQLARPPVARIAILRFENLGSDAGTDWMGRAFSEVITSELQGSPDADPITPNRMHAFNTAFGVRPISAPGISAERTLALASGATRIGYGDYAVRGGRLEAQLTIEDPRTGKMMQVLASSAAAGDVIAAASGLARQISHQTHAFGTQSEEALKAWTVALESGDITAVGQSLEASIASDPDFGAPYLLLAQWKAQRQDRAGALSLLEQARARGDRIPPGDRARIDLELANLKNDSAGRQTALAALVKLEPDDSTTWRALAETALSRRDYATAIQGDQKSVELEPGNTVGWNQLGYARAFAGDLNGALDALHRYQALRPADSDPLDSQGDVNLLLGHLPEAEKLYLEAARKSPNFPTTPDLFKAAMARLMTGDVPGADGLVKPYVDARRAAHDPLVDYFEAEWWWVSGRRKRGYQQLAAFAQSVASGPSGALHEMATPAYAELAIWSLFLGDRAAAQQILQKSAATPAPPGMPPAGASASAMVLVARFLAQPPASPAEWAARADRVLTNANARETTVAYALLLDRQFGAASPVLKQIYDRSSPVSDDSERILLAWSWLESGHAQEAAPLLRLNPIPQLTGPGPLVSLYFPRIFYLRALAAEKDGKPDVARANYRAFLEISGADPLVWGEEKKAQAAQ